MEKKKTIRAEKSPDKLKRIKKDPDKKVKPLISEEDDILDMDLDNEFRNHGFEDFEDDQDDDF